MQNNENDELNQFTNKAALGQILSQTEPPPIPAGEDRDKVDAVAHFLLLEALRGDSETIGKNITAALKYVYSLANKKQN